MNGVERHQELFTDSVSIELVDYGVYDGIPSLPTFSDTPDFTPPNGFVRSLKPTNELLPLVNNDDSGRGADLARRLGPLLDKIIPDQKNMN